MTSYLSYETEQREIRIVPVNVLELDLNVKNHGWQCNYSEFFRMSFLNDTDAYEFLKFFEIDQEENSKYIKSILFLYHKEMRFVFNGCFPTEFTYDTQEVEIHYDHFESHTLKDMDKLLLLSQTRHKKLESLGI